MTIKLFTKLFLTFSLFLSISSTSYAATLVYSGNTIVGANGFIVNGVIYNAVFDDIGFASRPNDPQDLLLSLSVQLSNFLQTYKASDLYGKFNGASHNSNWWNSLITPLNQYSNSHINIASVRINASQIYHSIGTMQITGSADSLTQLLEINTFDTIVSWEAAETVSPVPLPAPIWLLASALIGLTSLRRKYRRV